MLNFRCPRHLLHASLIFWFTLTRIANDDQKIDGGHCSHLLGARIPNNYYSRVVGIDLKWTPLSENENLRKVESFGEEIFVGGLIRNLSNATL